MIEENTTYIDVILPLALGHTFTYSVPAELSAKLKRGQRVVVQFGAKKLYSAIVYNIHQNKPDKYKTKDIFSILDEQPIVNEYQLFFWDWLAAYYMCTEGEVMNAALPSALKLASESELYINPDTLQDFTGLNNDEFIIAEALNKDNKLTISDIANILGQKNILPCIKRLIEKGVAKTEEKITVSYKPKTLAYLRLSDNYIKEEKLKVLLDTLETKAEKQFNVLLYYLQLSCMFSEQPKEVSRKQLLSNSLVSATAITSLINKGILEVYEKKISRLIGLSGANSLKALNILNNEQTEVYKNITELFGTKEVVLLDGITSSGKTEIYIHLINSFINEGKQVLYLVPEIALTTQLINRLRNNFGEAVGIYHSRFTGDERLEIWNNIAGIDMNTGDIAQYKVIAGPRSALFLPFSNLGLVIIDEEHDASFKQTDPAPRYNARDAAIYLAHLHKARVLLGSATPSIESYYNARTGKYGLVELKTRYGDMQLPEIKIVDVKEEIKKKQMKSHFSPLLLKSIQSALDLKQQVILFQNRRGYSLRLECSQCQWIPGCKRCDVILTYHKKSNLLRCHYCGYSEPVPDICPACHNLLIKMKGFGTEKIEDEMPIFFPSATVARMDIDTTSKKNAYQKLIADFEDHNIDILVGTQMITKGLDFDNVGVVGVLNADSLLFFPDFRTNERAFQQLVQVCGRAGRRHRKGLVIIQTQKPLHPVILDVVKYDYLSLYNEQIQEREVFKYPPFYRLIRITLKHSNKNTIKEAARLLAQSLKIVFGENLLGPEEPPIAKINNLFIRNILLK
nr:primosomal protein N' [Bacteroidales bacterium]